MDREALVNLIRQGPVRVTMNNGEQYEIPNSEFGIVSDLHAVILVRDAQGVLREKILSLVCMCSAEPFELAS